MKNPLWVKLCVSGISDFKMVVKTLKMTSAPAHQQPIKMSQKWRKKSQKLKKWFKRSPNTIREALIDVDISNSSYHEMCWVWHGWKHFIVEFCTKTTAKRNCARVARWNYDDTQLLKRVITGDVSLVYRYNLEMMAYSSREFWIAKTRKVRQVRSSVIFALTYC